MAEISNTTLAVLVFAALVVVVAGAVINLNSVRYGPTGFATSDTGNVNLTINATLAIQVNAAANLINFGQCVPRPSTSYSCSSNDSQVCDGTGQNNCTGDTASPQYIQVDNVGNIDANVTVTSECDASTLIGGSSPGFWYMTLNCNGTNQPSWTNLNATAQRMCTNVSYLGGQARLYANVSIPNNAVGGTGACADRQSTLTFTATQSP